MPVTPTWPQLHFPESNYFTSGANTPVARGSVYPDYENLKSSWDDFFTAKRPTEPAGLQACGPKRTPDPRSSRRCGDAKPSPPQVRELEFGFLGAATIKDVAKAVDPVAVAYTNGVPMGGMLEAPSQKPLLFSYGLLGIQKAHAAKSPDHQRLG